MKRMSWVLLVSVGLLSTWIVYQKSNEDADNQAQRKRQEEKFKFDKFQLAGFEHTQFKDGRKLFTLYCKEIIHRKRKIGPFTVNPVKEIQMSKVRIELFQKEMEDPSKTDTFPHEDTRDTLTPIVSQSLVNALKKMLDDRELGFISRIVISDFTLDVSRNEQKQITIRAQKATLGSNFPDATFDNGFSIVSQNNQEITAKKAVWNQDRQAFHIPGSYAMSDDKGQRQAANAFFGIDGAGRIIKLP